jgi:anti-anti-sigma regulatory factor
VKRKSKAKPAATDNLQLGSKLSIANAGELHQVLLSRLNAGKPIVLDGSKVEEVDTAILQLLASLKRTAAQRGVGCTWLAPSTVLRDTAELIGLAEPLAFTDVTDNAATR